MKIKKYLIFLGLFMVLMYCVGAIGAATDDAMDIVSSDDLSSDYNGEQVIGVDENTPASIAQGPDESADPQISVDDPASPIEVGPCSFTEFNNKLWYGSVFSLTGNITRSENDWQEIGIGEGMNITIYGNGYAIDANKLGRCFVVYPGGELTLINVKLVNGYLPPTLDRDFDGGAILNMGTLTIVDCEFRDNYARDGGAISCDKVATTAEPHFFTTIRYGKTAEQLQTVEGLP